MKLHKAAVESDLVKLTKEFESLRLQLDDNDKAQKEHRDSIDAALTNYQMSLNFHNKKIAHLQRQRRTLEAQFTNVTELLQPMVETQRACNGCVATSFGDYSEQKHPLFNR